MFTSWGAASSKDGHNHYIWRFCRDSVFNVVLYFAEVVSGRPTKEEEIDY